VYGIVGLREGEKMTQRLIEKLKAKQKALGMSDKKFAKSLGISRQMWIWLKDGVREPGEGVLKKICANYPEFTPDALSIIAQKFTTANTPVNRENNGGS
jgi:transcriptional regulator with XRE-family HTH domain